MKYEAVRFREGWKAIANGSMQRPDFGEKGPAILFAKAVAEGRRKPEPVRA